MDKKCTFCEKTHDLFPLEFEEEETDAGEPWTVYVCGTHWEVVAALARRAVKPQKQETKVARIYYRIVTPPTYSNIETATQEEAEDALKEWGECPKGTAENKAYWKGQQALCKIVKVTEIIEEIDYKKP